MRPLFTVHAGEYLVGSHIEQTHPRWCIWVPAKDTGIGLLVTDSRNRRAVSLQVKFSKDFNPTNRHILFQNKLRAMGWWRHQPQKIKKSQADFWVFVLPSFIEHETSFIIIPRPNSCADSERFMAAKESESIRTSGLRGQSVAGRLAVWQMRSKSGSHSMVSPISRVTSATTSMLGNRLNEG
jgi:hypothetical protein